MTSRVYLQGFPVDILTYNQALECAKSAIDNGENMQVVTINPEMVELAKKNKDFANVLKHSELVVADGVGIKIALKLKGVNQERIGGVDYSRSLIEMCARNNLRLALLGAKEEVINTVCQKLKCEFENLNIVFSHNGYFSDENAILNEIKKARPQVLLCALGAPKQEFIIYRLKEMLQGCTMVGVGGSFDVFAGCVQRAPLMWQKLGLEWLYRTIKQPERFRRIFPTLPIFLFESIIDSIKK
ncbi:TPA: WecB/TagA/CpsF family glycosyltransferase [Candidatus Galligastranaerophilus faecipullorum]|nr:WecB/TagA/CpsF family glycosyltransferase [Candidatus Galligastranaerophilus faecipullorum]